VAGQEINSVFETRQPRILIMKSLISILFLLCCLLYGCTLNSPKSEKKIINSSQRETGYAFNDRTIINYFVEGNGYPCIVVAADELLSKAISDELKDQFRFIFISSRADMKNPGDISKISFDLMIQDIDQVRKSLKLQKVGIFGHSVFGKLAFEYARNYPQYTAFAIVNGSTPYVNDRSSQIEKVFWQTNASEERRQAFETKWKGISRDSLYNVGTSDSEKLAYILDGPKCWYDYNFDATQLLRDGYWNARVFDHIFNKLVIDYDVARGRPIEVPVFLSLGKHDFLTPYILWDDQKDKIKDLSYNLFERSGHFAFMEEEELFRQKVMAWIENIKNKNKLK
jgi:proline iminopeptidase